jgi:translation initiation factor IF-2
MQTRDETEKLIKQARSQGICIILAWDKLDQHAPGWDNADQKIIGLLLFHKKEVEDYLRKGIKNVIKGLTRSQRNANRRSRK